MGKQAVVVIHGMGEQIPMETLVSFVDAVWTSDDSLVDRDKPDPDTGQARARNAFWSKPDRRTRSFELRVVTTESDRNDRRTDFFEYYWAHLMNDTTWEHLRAWVFELMLRNPFTKVPRGVLAVWILLWLIVLGALAGWIIGLDPGADEPGTWIGAIAGALVTAALAAFISGFLVRYFGDVARYVKAKPENVARRQEIRENGVQLLETLMGVQPDGSVVASKYDRIIVVSHSLGTVVAYDILTHVFARVNRISKKGAQEPAQQERLALEAMIRDAADNRAPLGLDAYQAAQERARKELNEAGNPWIVSDFVTLGSPLTHSEFLIVRDRAHLSAAKQQRILPTCPPTLEYDRKTKLRHFTYRPPELPDGRDDDDPAAPRVPHHAALFAYTRWSNIYSPHRFIAWGDIISGPLSKAMGMEAGDRTVSGIRDISVMPAVDGAGVPLPSEDVPFFTHRKYWSMGGGPLLPLHIQKLREVTRLGAP